MKDLLNEMLLLELREYLDRAHYGCWIDTEDNNDIMYVDKMSHVNRIRTILIDKHELPPNDVREARADKIYEIAAIAGYVRVVFEDRNQIQIEGTKEAIKKAAMILLASCVQPDVDAVYVDRLNSNGSSGGGSKRFNMPEDRRMLMMYIKDEVE